MKVGDQQKKEKLKVKVGDLVRIPTSSDIGIALAFFESPIDDFDLQGSTTYLVEVYWQNLKRSRLEMLADLQKIN